MVISPLAAKVASGHLKALLLVEGVMVPVAAASNELLTNVILY